MTQMICVKPPFPLLQNTSATSRAIYAYYKYFVADRTTKQVSAICYTVCDLFRHYYKRGSRYVSHDVAQYTSTPHPVEEQCRIRTECLTPKILGHVTRVSPRLV